MEEAAELLEDIADVADARGKASESRMGVVYIKQEQADHLREIANSLKAFNERTAIDDCLQSLWEAMQDDYRTNKAKFDGAIQLASRLNLITNEKTELWCLRVKNCPDPDHIGGRTWCAYCGDIEQPGYEE